jgi:hypothetical protein
VPPIALCTIRRTRFGLRFPADDEPVHAFRRAPALATLLALALLGPGCALPPPPEHPGAPATTLEPPVAPREPHATTLHGDTRVDHYYWLRNKGAPQVEAYLNAERAYAEASMQPARALQQTLYEEMPARIQQERAGVRARLLVFHAYRGTATGRRSEPGHRYSVDHRPGECWIRTDDRGGRSGRFDRLRERAFTYTFLLWQLGVERVP